MTRCGQRNKSDGETVSIARCGITKQRRLRNNADSGTTKTATYQNFGVVTRPRLLHLGERWSMNRGRDWWSRRASRLYEGEPDRESLLYGLESSRSQRVETIGRTRKRVISASLSRSLAQPCRGWFDGFFEPRAGTSLPFMSEGLDKNNGAFKTYHENEGQEHISCCWRC